MSEDARRFDDREVAPILKAAGAGFLSARDRYHRHVHDSLARATAIADAVRARAATLGAPR